MKETLRLHKLIINGPFPVTCLWHLSSSVLVKDLELAVPASLPSTNNYQTFVIASLTSNTLPAERIEEDPEDNIKLHNELSILNTLEARMEALDDQDDQSLHDAAMPPLITCSLQMFVDASCNQRLLSGVSWPKSQQQHCAF